MQEENLDTTYPEQAGYHDFIESKEAALQKFACLSSYAETERYMKATPELLQESAHTGRWFMLQCSEMVANAKTKDLRQYAMQLFLLDAACDAANASFMRAHGMQADVHASSPAELRECALAGVAMLFRGLALPGDPMQLRPKLADKVNKLTSQLVKRVAKQREAADAARKHEAREREQEKRAEAELARSKRRKNTGGLVGLVLLFLMLTMMASQYQ